MKGDILNEGFRQGEMSDLMLCLGSSMRVSPANSMAEASAGKGGKLVIVNLQKTPMDAQAHLVIHGLIDDVMNLLMEKIQVKIPQFTLSRWIKVAKVAEGKVSVSGTDRRGNPFQLFKKVHVNDKPHFGQADIKNATDSIKVELQFQGHYNEPNLVLNVPSKLLNQQKQIFINMVFNPYTFKWTSVKTFATS